jgi:hypothetical protein
VPTGTPFDQILTVPVPSKSHPENAVFALGFGPDNLIRNDVRVAYVGDALTNPDLALVPNTTNFSPAMSPAYGLRQDLLLNDLRNWIPGAPVLLCGGGLDPVVTFPVNTGSMSYWWQTNGVPVARTAAAIPTSLVTVLDLEAGLGAGDPFALAEGGFAQAMQALYQGAYDAASKAWLMAHPGDAAGAAKAGDTAGLQYQTLNYHQTVEPFCQAAIRGYFAGIP